MSTTSLFAVGLSGLAAQASSLEAISNNIANSQTVGFRRSRTDFSDLVARETRSTSDPVSQGASASTRRIFDDQGFISRTGEAGHLAIAGDGFFVVRDNNAANADAQTLVTRAGDFTLDSDGNLVNSGGHFLQALRIGAGGPSDNVTSLNSLETVNLAAVTSPALATSQLSLQANLSSTAALSIDPLQYQSSDPANNIAGGSIAADILQNFTVFDAEGQTRTLSLAFVRTGTNSAAVELFDASDVSGLPIASGSVQFGADGAIDLAASNFPQSISLEGAQGTQSLAIDLSQLSNRNSASTILNASNDGNIAGSLSGFSVNDSGTLTARFTNGTSRDLYQIPLALFTNNEGLLDAGNTAFQFDPAAGQLSLSVAGLNNAGFIESEGLETSTVDISQEFGALIETQRAYSANARIISVVDELLQTLNDTAA